MKLNPQKILDKQFESIINGYSPTKVDKFLDDVISDYNYMINEIEKLNNQIKEKEETIVSLKNKIKDLELKEKDKEKLVNRMENEQ